VHLGDKISGSRDGETVRKKHEEFFGVIKELKIPVHYTVGNHEITGVKGNEKTHEELFGPLYYSFTHNNCLFLVLNTESVGREGTVSGEQMTWLKDELEKRKKSKYIFVFLHRPLFSVLNRHKSYMHFKSEEHRNELAELFMEHNVSAVFAGHEHLYHSGRHDGLLQVVSGGGGAPFHFYPEGNFHHYLLIKVKEDSAVIRSIPVR
jgi:3',5'-cyclic AMP phosphodiesterase CpdA